MEQEGSEQKGVKVDSEGQVLKKGLKIAVVVTLIMAVAALIVILFPTVKGRDLKRIYQIDSDGKIIRTYWQAKIYFCGDAVAELKERGVPEDEWVSQLSALFPNYQARDWITKNRRGQPASESHLSGTALVEYKEIRNGKPHLLRRFEKGTFLIRPLKDDPIEWMPSRQAE